MSHPIAQDLETDRRAPPESGGVRPSFYEFPELYAALRAPDHDTLAAARRLIARYHEGPVRKVMDPACGPGTYLLPFADDGLFVAGNDLSPAMVRAARDALGTRPGEFTCGDMRGFRFDARPIDVAVELSGTSGHMLDRASALDHLRAVAANLRRGGLYLMVVFARTPPERINGSPLVTWEEGPLPIATGGEAWIRYEQVTRADAHGVEVIRRTVVTRDVPRCPTFLQEEYALRTWTDVDLAELAAESGEFEFLGLYPADPRAPAPGGGEFELIAALRRR